MADKSSSARRTDAAPSADPRPTSVNDTRPQPGAAAEADFPVDAGGTRTAAFDADRTAETGGAAGGTGRDPNHDIDA